jgi:hypothetical protein
MMLSRRKLVLAPLILGPGIVISLASAADVSARNFVSAIYNAYKGSNGNGISLESEAAIRRYFEPGLAALIVKDRKNAQQRGEAPALTGDPFVDSGDWDIREFDIAVQHVPPNKATGTIKFENFDQPRTVVLDLVKLKEGWRITDVSWQRDGAKETLRGLLAGQ